MERLLVLAFFCVVWDYILHWYQLFVSFDAVVIKLSLFLYLLGDDEFVFALSVLSAHLEFDHFVLIVLGVYCRWGEVDSLDDEGYDDDGCDADGAEYDNAERPLFGEKEDQATDVPYESEEYGKKLDPVEPLYEAGFHFQTDDTEKSKRHNIDRDEGNFDLLTGVLWQQYFIGN